MSDLTISPIPVPAALDAADAGPFLELVRIANALCLADTGHEYLSEEPQEALGLWLDQTDWTRIGFMAERDGVILGVAQLTLANEPGSTAVDFDVMADPTRRDGGVEDALLEQVERVAREHGRTTIQTWTLHRPEPGGCRLTPSTGWGSVPADDPQTVFHLAHGFTLEQVERNSVFDLRGPLAVAEHALADALSGLDDAYRPVSWTSPTPPEFRDSFAHVMSRMSTDAPSGGTVVEEQRWDAARVQRRDARLAAQGLLVSVAAVEHVPTGAVVAYNELAIAEDRGGVTHQYGTLVVKEHRGHRLGTIVKCANLLRWRELAPDSPIVSTFNAEENRYMLDVNEAVGFVPASYAGAWKKVLR